MSCVGNLNTTAMMTNIPWRGNHHLPSCRLIFSLLTLTILFTACEKKQQEYVTIRLKDGTEQTGLLAHRDDGSVTLVNDRQVTRTFLKREIATVVIGQPASAGKALPSSPRPEVASPATTSANPLAETPTPFTAPGNGRITLRAGTTIYLRTRELLDAGEAAYKSSATAQILDETGAEGGTIPALTNVVMEVFAPKQTGGSTLICSLVVIFPGGKEYRPVGGREKGVPYPLLGILHAPPPEDLPAAIRDQPYRLPSSSMITFKLEKAITLQEVK